MNQSRTLLVVGAHAADFVWRAAGVIAVVTTQRSTGLIQMIMLKRTTK
jgi:LmbE family N-acetylglucosaminyl deacetylase